ncbi:hypothetical protein ATEIFO6365_0005043900 [Aspergillus terreus]|uniref:Rhodopsin domain-containing protein n=1 Tax=Aspergillus terreus TaxID=33178 RepID=A0A5M3Z592_ASPTE|nr:hypothetical protein ATETN484_0007044400 [Aspergillus terreus]GFF16249.1 hypothetical protein ATEIFO6365_0005043900 [Aspergillus terreus]
MPQFRTRRSLSHDDFETISDALVIFGMIASTAAVTVHTYTSVRIMRDFGAQNILSICSWALLAIVSVFIPTMCMAKMSMITLYYRLNPFGTIWRVSVLAIAIVIVVPTPVLVLLYIFGCRPVALAWNPEVGEGQCISRLSIMFTSSVLNAATDLMMVLIPIPLIRQLQMPLFVKVGALVMFFLGCITIITSIFRAIAFGDLFHRSDQSYHMAVPILWANAETTLVIICDCLPSFRRFLSHMIANTGSNGSGNVSRRLGSVGTGNPPQPGPGNDFEDDVELIRRDAGSERGGYECAFYPRRFVLEGSEPEE